jgi:hypothetical protein
MNIIHQKINVWWLFWYTLRVALSMSPCRLAYKPILFEPGDNVTLRQHAAQHGVWCASLAAGRQDESPTTRCLVLCRAATSDNTTHKSVPNQPPYKRDIIIH